MKKIALTLVTFIVMGLASVVGSAVVASPAEAATCFKTASATGTNAYGYAQPYSWSDWSKFVRTAPTATFCVNYSKAAGGYYLYSATCGQSAARLTSDNTSWRSGSNWVQGWGNTYLTCGTQATWKWSRTVGNDQCATLVAYTRWNVNQSNGVVTFGSSQPVDANFRPASC